MSAWSTLLTEIKQPTVQFTDADTKRPLCSYNFESKSTGDKTSVIMCKLERKTPTSTWAVTAIGITCDLLICVGELCYGRASNYKPMIDACKTCPPVSASTSSTAQKEIVPFYANIANYARKKAVSISVITMEGEDCSMENLGTAADISGGGVEIVDPLNMSTKMANILSRTVLATSVVCKLFLDQSLHFKNEGKGILSTLTREIGNVNVSA